MSLSPPSTSPRRNFFFKVGSGVIGAFLTLCPTLAGLFFLTDPLRRRGEQGNAVKVTVLGALPADGVPRRFEVIADKVDAWNKIPETPIGAVYLRRTGEKTVEALNVVCPHLGCFVQFNDEKKAYGCPCHNSSFALDGKILDPKSPSRRPLDSLAVEIREGNEVWVHFMNFKSGLAEKVPEA